MLFLIAWNQEQATEKSECDAAKRLNFLLNTVIGASVGVFIGHGLYTAWDFHAHPQLYAAQSAPWYAGILLYGIFTCIVLAVCIVLKAVFRRVAKKPGCKSTGETSG